MEMSKTSHYASFFESLADGEKRSEPRVIARPHYSVAARVAAVLLQYSGLRLSAYEFIAAMLEPTRGIVGGHSGGSVG